MAYSRPTWPTPGAQSAMPVLMTRGRKRIEEVFGWLKTTGGVAQVKVRVLAKVQAFFTFAILAYNLVRIPKLLGTA